MSGNGYRRQAGSPSRLSPAPPWLTYSYTRQSRHEGHPEFVVFHARPENIYQRPCVRHPLFISNIHEDVNLAPKKCKGNFPIHPAAPIQSRRRRNNIEMQTGKKAWDGATKNAKKINIIIFFFLVGSFIRFVPLQFQNFRVWGQYDITLWLEAIAMMTWREYVVLC